MITSTRRTRNSKFVQSTVWANTWNIRPYLFLFWFFPGLAYWSDPWEDFTHSGSKYALWRKEVPFWGPHDGRQQFGVQIPPKPLKMALYRHVRAATNVFETNDVIEDWRHWLRSVARSQSLAGRRILFIASWESPLFCIFQWLQRNHRVSWCTIFGTEIQFFSTFIQYL